MAGLIDPALTRAAALLKIVQSMTTTVADLEGTTRRDMVAYARAIRNMIEVSEPTMARALLKDLLRAVQEAPGCSGWLPVIERRIDAVERVM